MTNNKTNGSVPQIRFPEFTGEWREAKFKDIFCRVTSKNKENNQNILTISAQYGLVSQDKFFSKIVAAKNVQGYYLLHKNDYAYNKSYSKGYPVGAIKRLTQDKGVVSTLYICFSLRQPGSEVFFDQYFESGKHNREIQKIAQEGARNHGLLNISVDDFFDIKLIVPGAAEQQKIAAFLAAVDKRVALLECKVQQLEAYKRGAMQQLFSQQLRFTRPDGSHFPAWQEKRLGEIGKIITGKTPATSNRSLWGGTIDFITPSDIDDGKYQKPTERTLAEISNLRVLPPGSISFTCIASIGKMSITKRPSVTNQQINSIITRQCIDNEYLYYCLLNMTPRIRATQANTTLPIINKAEFSGFKVRVPCMAEQQKIAAFLSALDEKIALTRQQLDKTKQFKKGLLQRMFV